MTTPPAPLRVGFVPGVTPDKWRRIWAERLPDVPLELRPVDPLEQTAVLHEQRADMCFLRLPACTDGLHVIALYEEVPVVVAPRGHFIEAADEVSVADLAEEHLLQDPDDVPEWRDASTALRDGNRSDVPTLTLAEAVEMVAAGGGIVIVPLSLARLHARKDVVHRPVTGVAPSRVALAWRVGDSGDERVEAFIGIVRGRRATSSRGPGAAAPSTPTRPDKPDARQGRGGPADRTRGTTAGRKRGRTAGRGRKRGR